MKSIYIVLERSSWMSILLVTVIFLVSGRASAERNIRPVLNLKRVALAQPGRTEPTPTGSDTLPTVPLSDLDQRACSYQNELAEYETMLDRANQRVKAMLNELEGPSFTLLQFRLDRDRRRAWDSLRSQTISIYNQLAQVDGDIAFPLGKNDTEKASKLASIQSQIDAINRALQHYENTLAVFLGSALARVQPPAPNFCPHEGGGVGGAANEPLTPGEARAALTEVELFNLEDR